MAPSLAETPVLLLDAQATGANPARGELLELAWAVGRAADPPALRIESRLLRLRGGEIPRRVQRVTGIGPGDLRRAVPARRAWEDLLAAAATVAAPHAACPCVVHFARFEEPFLRALHPGEPFPLELLCTHALARRLVPSLPRKGLHALAGYLGADPPLLRRARDHVAATAVVWRELVARLAGSEGIRDLAALRGWLAAAPPPRTASARRAYPLDPALRRAAPERPGVYRLRRSTGAVLYVGKARSLRRRINSHFQKRAAPERALEMLSQVRRLDYTVTETALEAALLESDEIKRLAPAYNVALRERGRRLAFGSLDLRHAAARADARHALGPFASPETLRRLSALARLLEAGPAACDAPSLAGAALGLPEGRALPPDAVREALAAWLGAFPRGGAATPARRLLRAGARLDRSRPLPAAEPPVAPATEEPWSALRVQEALADAARDAARSIRRARWLCGLSESALVWEEEGALSLLVLSRGALVRTAHPFSGRAPVPPGWSRSAAQRRRAIDLVAYDRLSALTRELRALVARGAFVELRLSPSRRCDRAALAAALARL